ncbi:MAG: HEAT repeat domain-containing protein, partial [Candidatus Omnitrophica bacterium]|nr:HEAT repeat domain-containing protein [Candidatus Omnitrophota bacterium]
KDRPKLITQSVVNRFYGMLNDPNSDVRKAAVTALGEIAKDRPKLITQSVVNRFYEMLKDPNSAVHKAAVIALGEIAKTRPEFTESIMKRLYERLNGGNPNVRTAARTALGEIISKNIDLEKNKVYEKLINEKLKIEASKEDMRFITCSLVKILFDEKKDIASSEEVIEIACRELYPLFKKAKQIFKEVNYSLDNSLRYDEKLFWERYTNRFTELLSINPQIGMKFYENNIRIKGEKVTGPEKMAYLFDELRDVFSSSEATEYLSKIIARIPQKKLSNNAVIDILRIAQGCLLFRKRRILKDIAEKETYITSNEVIEKAGRQLLGDVIKKLGIDIEIDAKTVNNWIKYNNPWSSIIAFTTFYKRCKKNNLKIELGIIRETAENILKGTYKEYRYDT